MFKDLSNLYKKVVKNFSKDEDKKCILHIDPSEVSMKLNEIFQLKGSESISLINWENRTVLGHKHQEHFDMLKASQSICNMIQVEVATIKSLELDTAIEDISIIMDSYIHIIYLFKDYPHFCLYFVFNSSYSNLALAKSTIATLAETLSDTHRIALEKKEA